MTDIKERLELIAKAKDARFEDYTEVVPLYGGYKITEEDPIHGRRVSVIRVDDEFCKIETTDVALKE